MNFNIFKSLSIPKVIAYTYILIFIDRLITTFYWDFEANQIVRDIGIVGMWFIPLILFPFIIFSFALVENSKYQKYADYCAYSLFLLYLFVVLSNIWVIYA